MRNTTENLKICPLRGISRQSPLLHNTVADSMSISMTLKLNLKLAASDEVRARYLGVADELRASLRQRVR